VRVLVLGGTGSIGRGVVAALLRHGHEPIALARSEESANRVRRAGAIPVHGDLRDIRSWIAAVKDVDGVVHAAATWAEDMAATDRRVVEALLTAMANYEPPKAFVYTGGTWRYGHTGDEIATEESPGAAPELFTDAVDVSAMIIAAPSIRGMVIHPAMVYEDCGGVFEHFYRDARELGRVRVIGGEDVRWPLVHQDDLGDLYVLMLEKGRSGSIYNGSAIDGHPVGPIARAIARKFDISGAPQVLTVAEAMAEYGAWADGFAIDHQVSGRKAMHDLGWDPGHRDVMADVTGS